MLKKTIDAIKNIKFIVATIATSTTAILFVIEKHSKVISDYDVEIGVGLFSVLFVTAFIMHHLLNKKICKSNKMTSDGFKELSSAISNGNAAILKGDVERFYDNHIMYDSLRLHQSQRLHDLESRRKELGVNSFTQSKLKTLLSKPVDTNRH